MILPSANLVNLASSRVPKIYAKDVFQLANHVLMLYLVIHALRVLLVLVKIQIFVFNNVNFPALHAKKDLLYPALLAILNLSKMEILA